MNGKILELELEDSLIKTGAVMKEWLSGCGRIYLQMTDGQARAAHHPGPCDADVVALSREREIREQLDVVDPATLREVLKEYGAWNAEELADHEQNLQRVLWLAAGDIAEEVDNG
ncbi:hypothetical protein P3T23_004553 [Paraburkholderia sp. GAS448]|jgi:hypothetical protein|uniref:hypothetical protein n=1 Tax=Paraburkholderia sp. GAS448 TaxID=3035136 RepID=UPI003D20A69C